MKKHPLQIGVLFLLLLLFGWMLLLQQKSEIAKESPSAVSVAQIAEKTTPSRMLEVEPLEKDAPRTTEKKPPTEERVHSPGQQFGKTILQRGKQTSSQTISPLATASVTAPSLPFVLQEVPLETLELTPLQRDTLVKLQNDFSDTMTASELDANSVEYRELWDATQRKADERLRTLLGEPFLNWYRTETRNREIAEADAKKK